jgi:ubiquinone/menaquinone biosynthesis C-methylase UbiE
MNLAIKPKNYNDVTCNISWFEDSMDETLEFSSRYVKSGQTFMDFGAGTGNSTTKILNEFKNYEKMYVVDNSKSWLLQAKMNLKDYRNIECYRADEYSFHLLLIEKKSIDTIFSTNTIHLVKDFKKLARGFYNLLSDNGGIFLNSGNIKNNNNSHDLLFDKAAECIHGIAIGLLCEKGIYFRDKEFIDKMDKQRKFVFPIARDYTYYINALYQVGFKTIKHYNKRIKIYYSDWKQLLLLNRLQRGILPEVEDIIFREKILKVSIDMYFDVLKNTNPNGTENYFEIDYTFLNAFKR